MAEVAADAAEPVQHALSVLHHLHFAEGRVGEREGGLPRVAAVGPEQLLGGRGERVAGQTGTELLRLGHVQPQQQS